MLNMTKKQFNKWLHDPETNNHLNKGIKYGICIIGIMLVGILILSYNEILGVMFMLSFSIFFFFYIASPTKRNING